MNNDITLAIEDGTIPFLINYLYAILMYGIAIAFIWFLVHLITNFAKKKKLFDKKSKVLLTVTIILVITFIICHYVESFLSFNN